MNVGFRFITNLWPSTIGVTQDEEESNAAPPVSEDWRRCPRHDPHHDCFWPDRCRDQRSLTHRTEVPRQAGGRQELRKLHAVRARRICDGYGRLQGHSGRYRNITPGLLLSLGQEGLTVTVG